MGVKLIDAISGNNHWLLRADKEHAELRKKSNDLMNEAEKLQREIIARQKMIEAMEELQKLMPEDETITFLVPEK